MIERIIIENFKSIRKLDLALRPINILIGANGAGKSNFISFFELINRVYEGTLQEYSVKKGANNLLYRGIKHSESICGLLDFENRKVYKFELSARNDQSLWVSKFGFGLNPSEDLNKNYEDWEQISESQWLDELYGVAVDYLKDLRIYHFHDTSDTSPIKQIGPLDDNQYLRKDAGNLAAFLYMLQEKFPSNFRRIEMAIRSIAPFFERFNLKPRQLNSSQIKLEWKEHESDMYLDVYNLSDGSLRFIAFATLLLQPNPPKTIIIDEPELGLHPFAVQKLAALLQKASATSQIIVSTQSVEFVNQFNPEDVITVDRADGQSVFHRLEEENLQHWLGSFSLGDIWQKNVIGGQP
ncbi:MAG: AAA family ATPase [Saprospiraceae bacterium]|nr:AAA family ATPase [Saprospiraceae bacterium]